MKLSKVIKTLDRRLTFLADKIDPDRIIGGQPNWLWQEANALNIALECCRDMQVILKAQGRTTSLRPHHPGLDDIRLAVSTLDKHS
jgi:hypothetical protein